MKDSRAWNMKRCAGNEWINAMDDKPNGFGDPNSIIAVSHSNLIRQLVIRNGELCEIGGKRLDILTIRRKCQKIKCMCIVYMGKIDTEYLFKNEKKKMKIKYESNYSKITSTFKWKHTEIRRMKKKTNCDEYYREENRTKKQTKS